MASQLQHLIQTGCLVRAFSKKGRLPRQKRAAHGSCKESGRGCCSLCTELFEHMRIGMRFDSWADCGLDLQGICGAQCPPLDKKEGCVCARLWFDKSRKRQMLGGSDGFAETQGVKSMATCYAGLWFDMPSSTRAHSQCSQEYPSSGTDTEEEMAPDA
eukprot:1146803-Pelagomonas_calceolata.AAC.2